MSEPIWYTPVCDILLHRLQLWDRFYEYDKGYSIGLPSISQNRLIPFTVKVELISTRKFMDGAKGVIDKPTAFVHWIPWTKLELDSLVRIINTMRPNSPIGEIVMKMRELWTKQPGKLLSGGYRVLELAFYPGAIKTMIVILQEAKAGVKEKEQVQQGKEMFEV
jgi:hypothetical protein